MMTLIVYELVPEDTHLYLIPNSEITDEIRRVMEGAHNKLINADDDVKDSLRLSNMVGESSPEDQGNNLAVAEHNIFAKYKVEKETPIRDAAITHVYLSGWYL